MLGHSFHSMVINIPTACEICSSFMWLMEKGYVCQNCKLTCHKKCQARASTHADLEFNLSCTVNLCSGVVGSMAPGFRHIHPCITLTNMTFVVGAP